MSKSYEWGLLETDSNGQTQFIDVDEILKRSADGRMQLNHEIKQGLARLRKSEPGGMVNQRMPLGRPGYEVSHPPVLKRATEVAATTNSGPPKPLGRPGYDLPSKQQTATANQSQAGSKPKPLGRPSF